MTSLIDCRDENKTVRYLTVFPAKRVKYFVKIEKERKRNCEDMAVADDNW